MQRLDAKIAPLLEIDGEHFNRRLVLENLNYDGTLYTPFLLIQEYLKLFRGMYNNMNK